MVCGDAFLLDFWCGFAEIFILFLFLFAVLQFYETKRFAVFRIQYGLRFSYAGAPVLCYSLRFLNVCLCCYVVFLPPPPPHQTLTPPSNFDLKTELGHYKISPDRTTSTPRDANWFAHERPKKLSATYTSRLFFSLHLNVPEAYLKLKILSFLYKSLTWISQISDVKLLWSQYVLLRTIMAHVLLNKKSRVLLIS